jgi:UDP-3-O-acyl-N-acetylglucosamine deacetylase
VDAILSKGIKDLAAPKNFLSIETPVEYLSHQTSIRIEPFDGFEIHCEIDYNHPMITNQTFIFRRTDDYAAEIAPARTFCFDYEIEALKKKGISENRLSAWGFGEHRPMASNADENGRSLNRRLEVVVLKPTKGL